MKQLLFVLSLQLCVYEKTVNGFHLTPTRIDPPRRAQCTPSFRRRIPPQSLAKLASVEGNAIASLHATPLTSSSDDVDDDKYTNTNNNNSIEPSTIWEQAALTFCKDLDENPSQIKDFVQYVTLLRVGVPSLALAAASKLVYPAAAMMLAEAINDSGVFAVVSFDLSQFIQNILTTSGLVFSILVGQTFYFMYQQQEAIYLALFEEVTMAKSLLEQVALVSQGRNTLYQRILECLHTYVHEDLTRWDDEPAVMLSDRPEDDPLENILFLTSVGEPSTVYQTVRSLRQSRANRLGALQRKLPSIHMVLLWVLFGIVLFTFPLLGAGAQTIGGPGILAVQSWYLGFIVFGMALTMGIVDELQRPSERGAYNSMLVLNTMAKGLISEIDARLDGRMGMMALMEGPSVDGDGWFDEGQL